MQITVNIDAALGRKVFLVGACALGVWVLGPAIARATVPNTFTPGTPISASQMNANFNGIDARVTALEAKLAAVSVAGNTVTFTGVNVQIKNAAAVTSSTDGTGNLIIGHNENGATLARSGSHNLIVGADHGWAAHSGIATGRQNAVNAEGAALVGGRQNTSAGEYSVVVGGELSVVENNGTGDSGLLSCCFATFNTTDASEEHGVRIAYGAAGVGVGDSCFLVEMGTRSTLYSLFGNGTGNVSIGGGFFGGTPNNLFIGQNVPNVSIGQGATQVTVGQQAGSVNVGQSLTATPAAGGTGNRQATFGINAQDVVVGNGAGNVTIAAGAGSVGLAANLQANPAGDPLGSPYNRAVAVGFNAFNVVVGQGANGVSIAEQAGFANIANNLSASPAGGGSGSRQCFVGLNAQQAIFGQNGQSVQVGVNFNVGNTANVQLGIGAASVNVGP